MSHFSLEQAWVYSDPPPIVMTDEESEDGSAEASEDQPTLVLPNADSTLGIGDDNVWLSAEERERQLR